MKSLLILILVAVPAIGHAQTNLHFNLGGEILGSSEAVSGGFRAHVLGSRTFGDGSVRPQLAVGGTFGAGYLSIDDMRALDGSVTLGLITVGPEVQAGLRFVGDQTVDNRLYLSLALLRVGKDRRLQLDDVAGVSRSSAIGYRTSIGASWMGTIVRSLESSSRDRDSSTTSFFTIITPSQAEIVWERDAGSDRYGVQLGWGI